MSWPAWTAVGIGLLLLLYALRQPLAARLGWRNAIRHKRQTAVVIVGLLVGTAVVSASLTTGDSLDTGLKETSIAMLGDTDVLVHVPGELFVPEDLLDRVVAEPLPEHIDGTSRTVIARAAVEAPATDRYEARVPVVGFDAEEDAAFGEFQDTHTGEATTGADLREDEVYLNRRIADRLQAAPGDRVNLTYRPAFLPFTPVITWANGTLQLATANPDGDGGWDYHHAPENENEANFEVPGSALGVIAFVLWQDPTNATDLDLELVDPDGNLHRNDTGAPEDRLPDLPLTSSTPHTQTAFGTGSDADASTFTSPSTSPIPRSSRNEHTRSAIVHLDRQQSGDGEWTLRVHAKHALQQDFVAGAVVLESEYDLQRALRKTERLQAILGDAFGSRLRPDPDATGPTRTQAFTVKRIVEVDGKGGFFGSPTLFMPKATAQTLWEVEGRANWLKITHHGTGLQSVQGSQATVSFIQDRLETIRDQDGDDPSSAQANLEARAIKQEFLEQSEEAAALFTRFLALVGSFTLVAGMLLIVNLFTMLGEERRRELGMIRALGLARRPIAFSLIFEGGLYTLAAAAVGALTGILIAGMLVLGLNTLAPADSVFRVPLAPRSGSLLLAFAVGALLTFATVAVAAYRASRFDVARALRDEEDADPRHDRRRHRRRVFAFSTLLAATVAGTLLGSFLALSLGPVLVLFAAGPLLAPVLGRDRAWRTVSLIVVVLVLAGLLVLRTPLGFEGDLATIARALALIVAGSVFLVHAPAIPRAVSRAFSKNGQAASVVRVALAYPLRRPMRTGLTVSMYSLVILVLVVFTVLFAVMTPDPTRESGGYDLIGRSPEAVDDGDELAARAQAIPGNDNPFAHVAHVDALAEHREFGEERVLLDGEPPSGMIQRSAWFIGMDEPFAQGNDYSLFQWDPSVGDTEREVWEAVAADPELVLVSYALVGDPTQPRGGDLTIPERLTINTTGTQKEYRVAGITEQVHLAGVWLQRDEMRSLFPQAEGFYLFRLHDDADPHQATGDLERSLRGMGMQVTSVEEEAREVAEESERVYYLLSTYLGLGILVGVASLGIVTSRAVMERRRETGMLRAIGFSQNRVAAVLLTEALYLLGVAVVLGVGLGLLVARAVYEAEISNLPGTVFLVPWGRILILLGTAVVATLVAVGIPVYRAGRTPPSAAIRTVD